MVSIEPVRIKSAYDISAGIEHYTAMLKEKAIVAFRETAISRDQQLTLHRLFGAHMGWYPNNSEHDVPVYVEDHSYSFSQTTDSDGLVGPEKDQILIPWHVEHDGFLNPAIGASWNMELFRCHSSCGTTLFVNLADLFDSLTKDEKKFLELCKVSRTFNVTIPFGDTEPKGLLTNAVEVHPNTGRKTLRLNACGLSVLSMYDDRKPTDQQTEYFNELTKKYCNQIWKNKDIQQIHKWKENDLVFVDLFVMAHAVTGGFDKSERRFHGCWATKLPAPPRHV
jgi:alpha-ketoglutarate-dependent taurine dioxygenase